LIMPNAEQRDPEETSRALTEWLKGKIPAAGDLTISGLGGPSDTGFSSETLLFEARFREGGEVREEQLVARLHPTGFTIFPSYDIPLQYRVMDKLWDSAVPVPRMRWLEENTSVLGVPFYVMDRVEGLVPTDTPPYHTAGWVSELPPKRRELLWWNGLAAMAEVHKLDWRGLGFESLSEPERGNSPLEQQLHYYDEYFSWGMDRSRFPATQAGLDYLLAHRPKEPQVGLCWGDSRLANQIFHREECVAVIDWEMVHLGSPVEDLAWWLMADRCFSEGISAERSEGFPKYDETVGRWEELTGFEAADLAYYEVLALFRFSIHIGRIGLQMKHKGVIPDESEFDVDNLASQMLVKRLSEVGAR
jgi:aminoglycoside phosphotransferase (APT) family kinase protein